MPVALRRPVFLCLALALAATAARADDWPQWLGPKRDGVWREQGILDKFPEAGPKVKWRTPIGAGYAGPAVAGGKVYVCDRLLDDGAANPQNPFGRDAVSGKDRVLCLDAATGKILWKHDYPSKYEVSYPSGPRTTPVVAGGKVWTLGTMGELLCLDAANGKVLWSKDLPKDFEARVPMWGFSASPLLDGDRLICLVGGPGSLVVAFNKDSGEVVWKALTANEPGYCPPMIYEVGGKRQLIIWHPEAVTGLDPENGKPYWTEPWRVQAALTVPTPRLDNNLLFLTSFYNGPMMLKFKADDPKPEVLWKGKHWKSARGGELPEKTDGLHSIMPTPVLRDGYIYGVCSHGELRCLKSDTGERVWESLQLTGSAKDTNKDRWNNAFLVPHGDRYFFFTEKGDLVIGKLSPKGYEEISRAHILDADNKMARGRNVVWSHPAFADRCCFARNDHEIVCVSLADDAAAGGGPEQAKIVEQIQALKGSVVIDDKDPAKPVVRVDFRRTKVADKDLEALKGLPKLQGLVLYNTPVGDTGLEKIKELTSLQWLNLDGTKVTNDGLAHLKGLTGLQWLNLDGTKVGDAGVEHLKDLKALEWLNLSNTQVTDAGLAHLKGLDKLQLLYLTRASVTDAGVADLQKALPKAKIVR